MNENIKSSWMYKGFAHDTHQKYALESFKSGADIVEALAKQVNGGSSNAMVLGMLAEFNTTHRYLQSELLQALAEFIRLVHDQATIRPSAFTDARNEYAVMTLAKEMTKSEEIYIKPYTSTLNYIKENLV